MALAFFDEVAQEQKKSCPSCKTIKSVFEFSPSPSKKDGKSTYCKLCNNKKQQYRHQNNVNGQQEKNNKRCRFNSYKRRYGLEDSLINKLLTDRSGECEICKNTAELIVDHCHSSNNVRGLICSNCNLMLGHSKDSVDNLLAAIEYLKEYK
jgi:hypothetical protein